MNETVYFDTSALAKWYLNEPRSDEVEKYIQQHAPVGISDLTVVEMRSLLARRRREKNIDGDLEAKVFVAFQEDIRCGHLLCHSLPDDFAAAAVNLFALLSDLPLRTLDAMHLAVARDIPARTLATADKIMAAAPAAMGFGVVRFH